MGKECSVTKTHLESPHSLVDSLTMTPSSTTTCIARSPRMPNSPRPAMFGGTTISLSCPFARKGKKFKNTADTFGTAEKTPDGSSHAFHPPVMGDSRGPCPALNTLANHGYLPRSGHNITPKDLLAALRNPETYNISTPLALVLVYGGFAMMRQFNAPSISLHQLAQHGLIEHDASVVHKNTAVGDTFAPTRCDTALLDDLLESKPLTLEKVAWRRVALESVSPLDPVHQEIARGEWALVLDFFGREHGECVPLDILRVWLKNNRFPEEWKPTHEQGLIATRSKANEIHRKMNEYRKRYEEFPKECLEGKGLWSELNSPAPSSVKGERQGLESETPPPHAKRRKMLLNAARGLARTCRCLFGIFVTMK